METAVAIKLTRKKLERLAKDPVKSAETVDLVYVSDTEPGVERVKEGEEFSYLLSGKNISDEETLKRIKSLVIPPAWTSVWICTNPKGHLQVTGVDAMGRKQYKYHPLWSQVRNHTKFNTLYTLGQNLPAIRKQIQTDMAKKGLPQEKVLAVVLSLMQCTCIRIGSSSYEKMYGSFGITTLKDRHVDVKGSQIKFSFKGKKGVYHNITLKSKKLANLVQRCKDIPGKELFQYYDSEGNRHSIDSGMVNNYMRQLSQGHFTAKDLRTWAGTVRALEAFKELGPADTEAGIKKNIVQALDMVAEQLGNTRTVCKKYYVHPSVIDLYTNNKLTPYLERTSHEECTDDTELNNTERVLMDLLRSNSAATIV